MLCCVLLTDPRGKVKYRQEADVVNVNTFFIPHFAHSSLSLFIKLFFSCKKKTNHTHQFSFIESEQYPNKSDAHSKIGDNISGG